MYRRGNAGVGIFTRRTVSRAPRCELANRSDPSSPKPFPAGVPAPEAPRSVRTGPWRPLPSLSMSRGQLPLRHPGPQWRARRYKIRNDRGALRPDLLERTSEVCKVPRAHGLDAGRVFAAERRHVTPAPGLDRIGGRVEPQPQMEPMHGSGCRIELRVRKRVVVNRGTRGRQRREARSRRLQPRPVPDARIAGKCRGLRYID